MGNPRKRNTPEHTQKEPPLDRELTEWAIRARHRIQHSIHDLYRCSLKFPAKAKREARHDLFHLMVGASFGLWRSAFLATTSERSAVNAIDSSRRFLSGILTSNIVNFGDENKSKEWSSGHYLGNAGYRLARVPDFVAAAADSPPFQEFLKGWPDSFDWAPIKDGWEVIYAAHRSAIDWLLQDLGEGTFTS